MKPSSYMAVMGPASYVEDSDKAISEVTMVEVPYDIIVEFQPINDAYFITYTYGGKEHTWTCSVEYLFSLPPYQNLSNTFVWDATKELAKVHKWPVAVAKHFKESLSEIISGGVAANNSFASGGPTKGSSGGIASASTQLPAVESLVEWPCDCHTGQKQLWHMIQNLNDNHEDWDRERIADWIDDLHDRGIINAEFESWDDKAEPVDDTEPKKELKGAEWENFGWADEVVFLDPASTHDKIVAKFDVDHAKAKAQLAELYKDYAVWGNSPDELKKITKGDVT